MLYVFVYVYTISIFSSILKKNNVNLLNILINEFLSKLLINIL